MKSSSESSWSLICTVRAQLPDIGKKIRLVSGTDQFGQKRSFENHKGPNGLVILFYRSADWCPYCEAAA